jgi:hypothetical protein
MTTRDTYDIEQCEREDKILSTIENVGDHDRFSHWVEKDEAFKGLIERKPVVALCGKIWVPSQDPAKYPICPTCDEVLKALFLPIGDLP